METVFQSTTQQIGYLHLYNSSDDGKDWKHSNSLFLSGAYLPFPIPSDNNLTWRNAQYSSKYLLTSVLEKTRFITSHSLRSVTFYTS